MSDYTIHVGDCREVLAGLPDESVQCVVTSPPYWGLRDYGVDDQIGLESTPQEYTEKLVAVFREVRRLLRADGTLWLNLGDSYAKAGVSGLADNDKSIHYEKINKTIPPGLKPKDLVGIPWRVGFALQADGWWLRSDIIWHQPNPMPESVTDRPTSAHEHVFLLAKSERYYYDADAIREPLRDDTLHALTRPARPDKKYQHDEDRRFGRRSTTRVWSDPKSMERRAERGRNKRNVWTITTKPYPEAHFATFPEDLVVPCIKAGSQVGDTVLDPFSGAGTVGVVCVKHARDFIGVELNPEYAEIARKRIHNTQPSLFSGAEDPC